MRKSKSLGKGLENPFEKGFSKMLRCRRIEATGRTFLNNGFPQNLSNGLQSRPQFGGLHIRGSFGKTLWGIRRQSVHRFANWIDHKTDEKRFQYFPFLAFRSFRGSSTWFSRPHPSRKNRGLTSPARQNLFQTFPQTFRLAIAARWIGMPRNVFPVAPNGHSISANAFFMAFAVSATAASLGSSFRALLNGSARTGPS